MMGTPVTSEQIQARLMEALEQAGAFRHPVIGCHAISHVCGSMLLSLLTVTPEDAAVARACAIHLKTRVETGARIGEPMTSEQVQHGTLELLKWLQPSFEQAPIGCHAIAQVWLRMVTTLLALRPEEQPNVRAWLDGITKGVDQAIALHCSTHQVSH